MKYISSTILLLVAVFYSCKAPVNKEAITSEIYKTEKAFEKMVADSGVAIAFRNFADKNAVILRGNDSIIKGTGGIYNFYKKSDSSKIKVNWNADFIEVSEDGTLAYTYGNYCWRIVGENDSIQELKGVFHTVWKLQNDGTWKYVWD